MIYCGAIQAELECDQRADSIRIDSRELQVDDDGNIIESKFKTFGCGSAIASSSVATEWVKGKSIDSAVEIKNVDIAKHLSLPPVKLHCSMLAEDAIKAAVKDLKEKREKITKVKASA